MCRQQTNTIGGRRIDRGVYNNICRISYTYTAITTIYEIIVRITTWLHLSAANIVFNTSRNNYNVSFTNRFRWIDSRIPVPQPLYLYMYHVTCNIIIIYIYIWFDPHQTISIVNRCYLFVTYMVYYQIIAGRYLWCTYV